MQSSGFKGAQVWHSAPKVFIISVKAWLSSFLGISRGCSITLSDPVTRMAYAVTGRSERLGVKYCFGRDPS